MGQVWKKETYLSPQYSSMSHWVTSEKNFKNQTQRAFKERQTNTNLNGFLNPHNWGFIPPVPLTQANLDIAAPKLFSIETPNYWSFGHIPTLQVDREKRWPAITTFYAYRLSFNTCVCHLHRECHPVGSTNCYWWMDGQMVDGRMDGWTDGRTCHSTPGCDDTAVITTRSEKKAYLIRDVLTKWTYNSLSHTHPLFKSQNLRK